MAKSQINTKSKDYQKDKDAFLRELKQFHDNKSLPFKTPVVNGIEIDLYLFYSLVQQRGGLSKVNQTDAWDSFMHQLRLPHPCVNGTTLLRKIYSTYLEKYERAHGPPSRDDDNDLDEELGRRGRGGNLSRVSFGGAYISASGETLRTGAKPIAGPSERLALSLLSPMPNEQDFAVNVCTVLAADYSNRLPLSTMPHILDFLLAHAGVYNHSSLRDTIGRSYYEARGKYPDEFWSMRAGGGGAKELIDETKFMTPGLEQPELMVQALAAHNNLTDCLNKDRQEVAIERIIEEDLLEDWVTEPSEEDQLFAPELPGGAKCVFTQRVLQIASIVRSLSFHDENVQYLSRNTTLVRFLLLCANCWVGTLRQSGLDTLGNVCSELVIRDPATCLISRHILSTIQASLVSQDRARILAALEMLNKLSQNECNEEVLIKAIEDKVYSDVCALLTLRDIMVLVCTLECVYAVTSLGERACESVARVPGLVNTLVSLVTVEAQSYGPRACILMRVVETVSGTAADQQNQPEKPQATPQPQQMHNLQSPVKAAQEVKSQVQVTPVAQPATPAAPINNVQLQHMQQKTVQENEQFALAWLRASYEPLPPGDNSGIAPNDVYRLYVGCCTKLGRKGVIAPHHFPRLVRTVFGGTVGPNTVTISTGETQQMYVGIKARTPKTAPPQGPASPILKAQLTTSKAGVMEVKAVVTQAPSPQQATSHPHLSQALESPSNTTLIKHLLAHKVAQRQQNQQRIVTPATNNIIVQQNPTAMEIDPEALIKCTTILPGGVASTTSVGEKVIVASEETIVPKEESVQIQMDEQSQLTLKTAQNKMLADLLEKKSNPPVQVLQLAQQINAPTIQITETGQIVQVKPDNPDQPAQPSGPFYQIKNEQGQVVQLKNDQGQIIQLKNESVVVKDTVLQSVKTEEGDLFTGPPSKKVKTDDIKDEPGTTNTQQESVSKTAANLYAALAASALEDEEDLMVVKQEEVVHPSVIVSGTNESQPVIIQEPILQVQQPTLQVQQPTLQVQAPPIQVQPSTMQVQQPMLQVQPMDVQNIMVSQAGQIILQDKTISTQPTQFVQQPMQIIATPSTSQGGISYLAQNISNNMLQKTIIIVQGATGGGPITLTVNNPGGLDEATLNSVIAQATEAITQQQIIQKPPPLVATNLNGNSQIIQGIQGGQPLIVSNNQQIIVNAPVKSTVQRLQVRPTEVKGTVIQNNTATPTVVRQVVRQPIMVGGTKIGDKEMIVQQPVDNAQTQPKSRTPTPKPTVTPPPQPQPAQSPQEDTPWICHWRGCGKTFENACAVFTHAARVHCPRSAASEAPCLWLDCDRVPRKTFALLNHLNDRHCAAEALQAVYNSRRHITADSDGNKPVSLGYPPNAALAALNKHAVDFLNPRELMQRADTSRALEQTDENEGPVTKSIRLTAALILRNLVIYSNTGRRHLRSYEHHLATIAMSNVEASRTIAHVLYDMNNI